MDPDLTAPSMEQSDLGPDAKADNLSLFCHYLRKQKKIQQKIQKLYMSAH